MTRALLLLRLSGLCSRAARLLLARADRALGPPRKVTPPRPDPDALRPMQSVSPRLTEAQFAALWRDGYRATLAQQIWPRREAPSA